MIECPSCGMPVKKGATHCSACGEAITSGLTGSIRSGVRQTTALEPPVNAPAPSAPVIVEDIIPPTTNFGKSNGEALVQTCLRCNSVLNPAAKFCSVCGRATEPTPFERTIDATRTARGRAVAMLRRALGNVRERPEAKDGLMIASIVCAGLSTLCFLYSLYIHIGYSSDRPETYTVAQDIRSVWWIGFSILLMVIAAFLRR